MMDDKLHLDKIKSEIIDLAREYFKINKNDIFVPNISSVPVSGKVLDENDLINTILASLDMWYTAGDFTKQFEKLIAQKLGLRHSLFVNSGSSANLLALTGLKILYNLSDGDEIITSAVGFPTTINPIIQNNLRPVLVDAELDTLNIDPEKIETMITKKTKGIVIAHTLGIPFNLEKIKEICEKYNLFLMEDNCDSFGSTYNNKLTGTFGDVSTLSFYPAHHITTGEGGAVVTSNTKLKKIMESLRDWGRDCYCPPGKDNTCNKRYDWELGELPKGYDHKYIYSLIGYNLKATDFQAALGVSQIEKLDGFIQQRKDNYAYLWKSFQKFSQFSLVDKPANSDPSWFGFPVLIKKGQSFGRHELLKFYEERKIGTRLLFGGNIKKQPAYKDIEFSMKKLDSADFILENCFWLGTYPGLNKDMLDFIISSTSEFLEKYDS